MVYYDFFGDSQIGHPRGYFVRNLGQLTYTCVLLFNDVSAFALISASLYVTCELSRISCNANLRFCATIHASCSR